eukprot:PhM_4_TR8320/c0_g1_i3/m.21725
MTDEGIGWKQIERRYKFKGDTEAITSKAKELQLRSLGSAGVDVDWKKCSSSSVLSSPRSIAGCRADAPAVQQLLASLDYDQREELESLAIGEMQHFGTKFPAVNRPGMPLSEFRELVAGCRADAPAVQQLLATGPLQWPYKSKGFKLNICRRRLLAALVGIFRPSLR